MIGLNALLIRSFIVSGGQGDTAQAFLRQKEKNLNYFKAHLPRLYHAIENMILSRAELVVTPGAKDVDMTVNGESCYRGVAKEYSEDEVLAFLKKNSPDKPIVTFPPGWASSYTGDRFAAAKLKRVLEASPVNEDNFEGYYRGNFFPSIVILGCGLGYHIEALVNRALIVNAFIVERDPEKFALSLFTVDWASICSKFKRRGHSINFAIGLANSEEALRDLLARHLSSSVPFHPFLTVYYNHLADVELARTAVDVGKDIALIAANWSNYDDQLIRLKNTQFNVRKGINYLTGGVVEPHSRPLVVVGSGPSIDHRIDSLKAVRPDVVIVSAGTGIRPLLAKGIKPDIHVELDPSYSVHQQHLDLDREALKGITLLAVNEVNPHVSTLFDRTFYYFKSDNAVPGLLGVRDASFSGCNPTCTNAALALGYGLGFRKVFLFGTDYGFLNPHKDHSKDSVYGEKAQTHFAKDFQKRAAERKHSTFSIQSVTGEKMYTRPDFYSAKRSVERLLLGMKEISKEVEVFNCSDGVEIEGSIWLGGDSFLLEIERLGRSEMPDLEEVLSASEKHLDCEAFQKCLPELQKSLGREALAVAKMVKRARLGGRKDLSLLANELRAVATDVGSENGRSYTPADICVKQLIHGTLLRFVQAGLCHGLASDNVHLGQFLKDWRNGFQSLLKNMPGHFEKVMSDDGPYAENPWSQTSNRLPEPTFEAL